VHVVFSAADQTQHLSGMCHILRLAQDLPLALDNGIAAHDQPSSKTRCDVGGFLACQPRNKLLDRLLLAGTALRIVAGWHYHEVVPGLRQ
jgi:hypothetical protein